MYVASVRGMNSYASACVQAIFTRTSSRFIAAVLSGSQHYNPVAAGLGWAVEKDRGAAPRPYSQYGQKQMVQRRPICAAGPSPEEQPNGIRHAKQDNQMGAHIMTAPASAVGGAAPEAAKQKTRRQSRLPSVELPNNLRKNCEDCQVKPASYGPPGEGKVRWCASCAESHPGARCLSNPCEDCQRKTADYVSQGEGKRR